MLPFVLDFPNEYHLFNNGTRCVAANNQTPNESDSSSNSPINRFLGQKDCEVYCSRDAKCWGCTFLYTVHVQWNAMTHCEFQENINGLVEATVSQKLGRGLLKPIVRTQCLQFRI